jgi:predicted pyridoxine 5'-phosphate oxidase superfamily flavin-nucleotide-binding protein
VTVLDGDRLVLPDRPGNNRIDSLLNVLSDPRASMIFLIPRVGQTLRVNGTATVSTEESLLRLDEVPDLDAVPAAQIADLTLAESRAMGAASVDDPLW